MNLERQIGCKRGKSGAAQGSSRGVLLFPQLQGGMSAKLFSVLASEKSVVTQ